MGHLCKGVVMEEDIKVLENMKKLIQIEFKHNVTDREMKAIENLIARNKELENDNRILKEQKYWCPALNTSGAYCTFKKEDSISKSKAEELLEKLDKEEKQELKGAKGQDRYFIKQIYQAKRSVIEELLQEGDK